MKLSKRHKLWEKFTQHVNSLILSPEEKQDQQDVADIANEIIALMDSMKDKFVCFQTHRLRTIDIIRACIITVDEYNRKGNIATGAGAAGGIVGGLMSVGGIIAAPFTGGVSVVVAATGAVLASVGTVAQLSSDIAVQKFIMTEITKAKGVLDDDALYFQEFVTSIQSYENFRGSKLQQIQGSGMMNAEEKMNLACDVALYAKKVEGGNGAVSLQAHKQKPSEIVGIISRYGFSLMHSGKAVADLLHIGTAARLGITLGSATTKVIAHAPGYSAAVGVALDGMRFIETMNALATKELSDMSLQLREALAEIQTQYEACHSLMCELHLINSDECFRNPKCSIILDDNKEDVELIIDDEREKYSLRSSFLSGFSWYNFTKGPSSERDSMYNSSCKTDFLSGFGWNSLQF